MSGQAEPQVQFSMVGQEEFSNMMVLGEEGQDKDIRGWIIESEEPALL